MFDIYSTSVGAVDKAAARLVPARHETFAKSSTGTDCLAATFPAHSVPWEATTMLQYALLFLIIAIVAGILGFGGIAGAASGIAQVLFFIVLAFLIISVVIGLFRRAS
jgi:uncharacterized membrane protein YtjA (UPF0391 family)